MCRVLEVSPSGYYASRKRPPSWHALIDEVLMARVRIIHAESGETYGAPRVHLELQAEGLPASPKRVARLMREEGLVARPRKARRVSTTDSTHDDPIAPNRLVRQFDVNGVGIDRVWVADITYIPTREGMLYLAIVLDLGSRRCVGWAMRDTLEEELTLRALQMAREARRPAPGLIHHSDRGSHYTSKAYRAACRAHKMLASMSRKGDCWDNAVAESFFSTLEFELLMRNDWHTKDEARHAIFRYIEIWYNRKRRHSTLGYLSPADYELQLQVAA
jgi:transposase InsO family protein